MRSIPLLLLSLSLFAEEKPAGVIIHETGAHEPLAQGLTFFHGSWKFAEGAMLGEQVPTEKHTATIKILTAFDQIKALRTVGVNTKMPSRITLGTASGRTSGSTPQTERLTTY